MKSVINHLVRFNFDLRFVTIFTLWHTTWLTFCVQNNCRLCGHVFCGQCVKSIPLPSYDIPTNVPVCIPCAEKEQLRLEKHEAKALKKKELLEDKIKLEDMTTRFSLLKEDDPYAIHLKKEIDSLQESILLREKAKKEAKNKVNPGSKKLKKKLTEVDTEESIQRQLDEKCSIPFQKFLHVPSSNKCCLVLDIDYTLFDHRWHLQVKDELKKDKSTLIPEFKRPYLHEFLTTCYERYELIIWSATGMTAIDSKCSNLGIYSNDNYKVTLVLSKEHMVYVKKKGRKSIYQETVKPLEVIWRHFPQYSKQNTIHIDDLYTNFQLNPGNGLQIQPFKEASKNNDDTELIYLTKYLLLIAENEKDFSSLNHSKWKEYTISKLWEKQNDFKVPEVPQVKSKMEEIVKDDNKGNLPQKVPTSHHNHDKKHENHEEKKHDHHDKKHEHHEKKLDHKEEERVKAPVQTKWVSPTMPTRRALTNVIEP